MVHFLLIFEHFLRHLPQIELLTVLQLSQVLQRLCLLRIVQILHLFIYELVEGLAVLEGSFSLPVLGDVFEVEAEDGGLGFFVEDVGPAQLETGFPELRPHVALQVLAQVVGRLDEGVGV